QAALGVVEQGLGLGFVLGALGLELGQVGGGGRHGLALRDQEVAAVARLHGDLVTQVAEVDDLLQKDQIHGVAPLSVSRGMEARQRVLSGSDEWVCSQQLTCSARGRIGCGPGDATDQMSWLSVYGIRARKRARLIAVDSWRW